MMLKDYAKLKQVTQQLEHGVNTLKSITEHEIDKYHSDIKLITAVKALNFYGKIKDLISDLFFQNHAQGQNTRSRIESRTWDLCQIDQFYFVQPTSG